MRTTDSVDRPNRHGRAIVLAAATGAALTYFLDPRCGRRRRAVARDKIVHAVRKSGDLLEASNLDLLQRAQGWVARLSALLTPDHADATTLEARVRARLGRLCSHPRAIAVECQDGTVRLKGDVLERELVRVLAGVRSVRGVTVVLNDLTVHQDAGKIPRLQGEGHDRQLSVLQRQWTPGPRMLAGAAGLALVAVGLSRRSPGGTSAALGGAALLGRSILNAPWAESLGLSEASTSKGVHVDKSVHVAAEPQAVYEFWRDLENFPRVMAHVLSVRKLSDTLYRWRVTGPAGVPVEWQAEVTADIPGQLIAWRTVEGSPVRSSGVIQFEPDAYDGTHVRIHMSYRPPANALGHTVARILGADPRRQLDEDMARFKSYMELGKTRVKPEATMSG